MKEGRSDEGLWEQQFDPSNDFPPTAVVTKYVICTSPRCGSHFLGHLLHQAGGFGYPLEYVNAANLAVWTERARKAGQLAPFAYIKSIRTDRNGVFGIKVHHAQLSNFLRHEPDILDYRFITLERRDLLRQAVSYAWAAQTKSWISGMPAVAPAHYDRNLIHEKLAEITRSNAGWRRFLTMLDVEALHLVFEDVRADPGGAIRRIAAFVGVNPDQVAASPSFFPVEQAHPDKHVWAERFIRENRDQLARGDLLALDQETPRNKLMRVAALLKFGAGARHWRRQVS